MKYIDWGYKRSHNYLSCTEDSITAFSPDKAIHIECVDKCRAHPDTLSIHFAMTAIVRNPGIIHIHCICTCCRLVLRKMQIGRAHRGHNAVNLSESREALNASLEDCVTKLENYRSARREVPETGME